MAARALIFAILCGCGDLSLEVDPPLFVFNSYPANGATVAQGDLGALSFTFSEDLGAPDEAVARAGGLVDLTGRDGSFEVVREDRANVAYDPETYTLTVTLEEGVRAALVPGGYAVTVRRELRAASGRPLPRDFTAQFQVASDP